MENEKIDLYSIFCKYSPYESTLDTSTNIDAKESTKNNCIHNYEKVLNVLGVNPRLQKELRNGQNLVFVKEPSIENTVALFCLSTKDYSSKIIFNNYPVKFIQDNMSLILKRDFEHTDINFLSDIYDKLLNLIKSINSNEDTINEIIDTVDITINLSIWKQINIIKTLINHKLSYNKLYASDAGALSERDKLEFLELIQACLEDVFKFAYHVQDYMSATREDEILTLPEMDDIGFGLDVSLVDNAIIPNETIISNLSENEKRLVQEIFYENSKKYNDMCKFKKESTRKANLRKIKEDIERQLTEKNINSDIIKNLIKNIEYKKLSKRSCNEQRHLWEKIPSKELVKEAICNYQESIEAEKKLPSEETEFPDIHGICPELDKWLDEQEKNYIHNSKKTNVQQN